MGSRYRRRGLAGSAVLALAVAVIALRPLEGGRRSSDRGDPVPRRLRALVTRAVDGDTVEIRLPGRTEEVRYIGVDTPETVKPGVPVQCFGPKSSDFNHRLVEGRQVRLVLGAERRDVYGRLLAYVYLGREFVNAELVRRGFARSLTIPPNDRFAPLFRSLEQAAGRDGVGLWGACG
jgi:micrococcal nuclease